MGLGVLKKIRVFVSLFFFLLITFIFIDFTNTLSGKVIQGLLYLQFIPSLIAFLKLGGLALFSLAIVLLLSMLFGRVYCSTICPLGTLQDIIIWFNRRFTHKKKYRKQKKHAYLRYGILVIATAFLSLGMISPLLLLDPYSNYGRIVANLLRPVYLLLNNLGALILESADIYTLYRVEPGLTHWFSLAFSFGVFALIFWLSVKYARLFCNTLCPLGTALGLLSRYALFQIRLEKSLCTSCGKCSAVCKAGCIDINAKKVDFSRCVGCFNCLTSCPSGGVKYTTKRRDTEIIIKPFDPSRRNFIAGTVVAATALSPLSMLAQGRNRGGKRCNSPQEVIKNYPISPPGSTSLEHFNNACTACHLCVSACPTHVIKPSFLEYGLGGIMQPRLDYHANYCNFDCVVCSEVCPTGALQPLDIEEKHLLQLGKVKFIKHNCIVFTEGTDCGACSEHCPTKAVDMRPYRNNLFLPIVNPDICVGCGACEYACPTDPKSIFVEGNPVHLIADKPVAVELDQPDPTEDFPF